MDFIQAILLGLIQGLTEFLPVSSSGHLILAPALLGMEDQGLAMDAILHLATLMAIVIYFRADLQKLLGNLIGSDVDPVYQHLGWSIIAATFPAGLAGLILGDWIEHNVRSITSVACNLLFWSLIFLIADKRSASQVTQKQEVESLDWKRILFIGFAQAIALLPGTSRSGITIAAGLFSGLSQVAAARFSFLLGTPIIMAAGLYKTLSFISNDTETFAFSGMHLAAGFIVAFISGYLSIKLLMKIVSRFGLMPFIIYRVALAGILLVGSYTGLFAQ